MSVFKINKKTHNFKMFINKEKLAGFNFDINYVNLDINLMIN